MRRDVMPALIAAAAMAGPHFQPNRFQEYRRAAPRAKGGRERKCACGRTFICRAGEESCYRCRQGAAQ